MYQTVTVGKHLIFMSGENRIGDYSKMLSLITDHISEGNYLLSFSEGTKYELTGRKRFEVQYRERVARHLHRQLDEIARHMNKKMHRQYVHWCNALGRYVDEGE